MSAIAKIKNDKEKEIKEKADATKYPESIWHIILLPKL